MGDSKGDIARRRILQAILDFTSSNHSPPTIWDIKEITGMRSLDNFWRHLKKLRKHKFIAWEEHSTLTIEITDNGLIQLQQEAGVADHY